MEKAN